MSEEKSEPSASTTSTEDIQSSSVSDKGSSGSTDSSTGASTSGTEEAEYSYLSDGWDDAEEDDEPEAAPAKPPSDNQKEEDPNPSTEEEFQFNNQESLILNFDDSSSEHDEAYTVFPDVNDIQTAWGKFCDDALNVLTDLRSDAKPLEVALSFLAHTLGLELFRHPQVTADYYSRKSEKLKNSGAFDQLNFYEDGDVDMGEESDIRIAIYGIFEELISHLEVGLGEGVLNDAADAAKLVHENLRPVLKILNRKFDSEVFRYCHKIENKYFKQKVSFGEYLDEGKKRIIGTKDVIVSDEYEDTEIYDPDLLMSPVEHALVRVGSSLESSPSKKATTGRQEAMSSPENNDILVSAYITEHRAEQDLKTWCAQRLFGNPVDVIAHPTNSFERAISEFFIIQFRQYFHSVRFDYVTLPPDNIFAPCNSIEFISQFRLMLRASTRVVSQFRHFDTSMYLIHGDRIATDVSMKLRVFRFAGNNLAIQEIVALEKIDLREEIDERVRVGLRYYLPALGKYDDIFEKLRGLKVYVQGDGKFIKLSANLFVSVVRKLVSGQDYGEEIYLWDASAKGYSENTAKKLLVNFVALFFGVECLRNPAMFITNQMILDLILWYSNSMLRQGEVVLMDTAIIYLKLMPIAPENAERRSRELNDFYSRYMPYHYSYPGPKRSTVSKRIEEGTKGKMSLTELIRREYEVVLQWWNQFARYEMQSVKPLKSLGVGVEEACYVLDEPKKLDMGDMVVTIMRRFLDWYGLNPISFQVRASEASPIVSRSDSISPPPSPYHHTLLRRREPRPAHEAASREDGFSRRNMKDTFGAPLSSPTNASKKGKKKRKKGKKEKKANQTDVKTSSRSSNGGP